MDLTPQLGGLHRVHPTYQHRRPRDISQSTPEVSPPCLSQSSRKQEVKQRSESHVLRSESRRGPGSARSQGEEGVLSASGAPLPRTEGKPQSPYPHTLSAQELPAVLTAPWGDIALPPSGSQVSGRPGRAPLRDLRAPLKKRPLSGLCKISQGVFLR